MTRRRLIVAGVAASVIAVGATAGLFAWSRTATTTAGRPTTWTLVAGQTLSPETTNFDVEVQENGCADGIPAATRLRKPAITYGEHVVTVSLRTEAISGFHTCQLMVYPGSSTFTVVLTQPLGNRQVVDGNAGH